MENTNQQEQQLTKRQRRLLRQQQHVEEQASRSHRGRTILGLAFLFLLGSFALYTLIRPPASKATTAKKMQAKATAKSGKSVAAIGAEDWVRGKTDAKVTLIEYGDFQCPACGYYYPIVSQVVDEYGDRIQFAFREYPLGSIHPYGNLAAQAAESAGLQGKFWEMYDRLYDNQQSWSKDGDIEQTFASYAQAIGLDVQRWQKDLEGDTVKAKIKADIASGDVGGVDGTPSFYLNNVKIENPRNVEGFKTLLDATLSPS